MSSRLESAALIRRAGLGAQVGLYVVGDARQLAASRYYNQSHYTWSFRIGSLCSSCSPQLAAPRAWAALLDHAHATGCLTSVPHPEHDLLAASHDASLLAAAGGGVGDAAPGAAAHTAGGRTECMQNVGWVVRGV
jgi:hypothetical protein